MSMGRPVAVVAGALRGVGTDISVALAAAGFDLALIDVADDGAQEAVNAISALDALASLFVADLADISSHHSLLQRIVAECGPIACLVNHVAAPALPRADLLDVSPGSFDGVLDVHLRGTFFFAQAVARHMSGVPSALPRSIVTVVSTDPEPTSPDGGLHSLFEASLGTMTRLFAVRMAPLNIGVFDVRPNASRTPASMGPNGPGQPQIASDGRFTIRRQAHAQGVARAVAALAARQLAFATGSVICVDSTLEIA